MASAIDASNMEKKELPQGPKAGVDPNSPLLPQGQKIPQLPPKSKTCVAFSAEGHGHTSLGNSDVMSYAKTQLGGPWWNSMTFTAPEAGIYFFSIWCVRDSQYSGGTHDDVYIYLMRNGNPVGSAWAGETVQADRESAGYTVALHLNQGDVLWTQAGSDGGYTRHVARYGFTGFRICPP
jgi:hypothetical protein